MPPQQQDHPKADLLDQQQHQPGESLADAAARTQNGQGQDKSCAQFSGDDKKGMCCATPGCVYIGFGCLKVNGSGDEDKIVRNECPGASKHSNDRPATRTMAFDGVAHAVNAAKKMAKSISEKAKAAGAKREEDTNDPSLTAQQLLAPPDVKPLIGQASPAPERAALKHAEAETAGSIDKLRSDIMTMRANIQKQQVQMEALMAQLHHREASATRFSAA